MGLSEKRIAKLKQPGRYGDGRGLILQVSDSGAKSWLFRFERDGRERWMGLGPLHTINLVKARRSAQAARELLYAGVDPIEHRHSERDRQRAEARANLTFREAVERYLKIHEASWKNAKHIELWRMRLKRYVAELLPRPINAIDEALINGALAPIWTTKPETARRVRRRIKAIIKWVQDGQPLPTRNVAVKPGKFPSLPYADVPAFVQQLQHKPFIAAKALEFLILCANRPGEVTGAVWSEIDFEQKLWTIPAERMKMEKEHRVPLSERAIEILKELPREDGNPHIFIGAKRGKGQSGMTMNVLIKRMHDAELEAGRKGYLDPKQSGKVAVPHGFRSSMKDWAAEQTAFPNIVSEMALAHVVAGVESHYRRGDLLDKRRKLMETWAKYCTTPPAKSENNVTSIRAVA